MTSLLDRDGLNEPISDRVYELLLAQIYSGQLSPGTEINEAAIARQLGVSRGPVREAVRRLQGIQLITREPYLRARVIELSAESALELFQMRMGLEGVACYLAAERMTNEEIDRSEEHTSELQSRGHLVCRLLLPRPLPRPTHVPYTTLFRSGAGT